MDCPWKEAKGPETASPWKSERSNRAVYLSSSRVLRQQFASCLMRGISCRKQSSWSESIRRLDMRPFPFALAILRLASFLSPQGNDLRIERKYMPSTNSGGFSLPEVRVSAAGLPVPPLEILLFGNLPTHRARAGRLDGG